MNGLLFFGNTTITKTEIINNDQVIDLSDLRILTLFGLEDIFGNGIIDESVYTFTAGYYNGRYSQELNGYDYELLPINMIPCNRSKYKFDSAYFKNIDINTKYCIEDTSNLILSGTFTSDIYNIVEIFIKKCNNKTSKVVCKPESEINEIIDQLYITAYLSDIKLNPNDAYNPIENIGFNLYSSVSSKNNKELSIYYSAIDFQNNVLFSSKNKKRYYSFEKYVQDFVLREKNYFAMISLFSSRNSILYERNYYKFYQILTYIYVCSKLLIFIANLILYYIHNYFFQNHLISYFNLLHIQTVIDEKIKKGKITNLNQSKDLLNISNKIDVGRNSSKHISYTPSHKMNDKIIPNITFQKGLKKNFTNNYFKPLFNHNEVSSNFSPCHNDINNEINLSVKDKLFLQKHNLKNKFQNHSICNDITTIFKLIICQKEEYEKKHFVKNLYNNIIIFFDIMRYFKLYNDTEYLKTYCINKIDLSALEMIDSFSLNKENIISLIKNPNK